MGMHAVLYRSSQAIGATNASLSAIGFSQDVVTNNKILLQKDMWLGAATLFGTGMDLPRIQTPLLLQTASLQLSPWEIGTTPGDNPNTCFLMDNPTKLRQTENIDVQTTNTDAGAQTHNAILQLWDGVRDRPTGQRLKIFASSVGPATAGAWSRINMTYQDNLPFKDFAIMGMEVRSATGLVARLDIPGQALKPGVPVKVAVDSRMYWEQYKADWGALGRFNNQALPAVEIFCTAADALIRLWLDVIVLN